MRSVLTSRERLMTISQAAKAVASLQSSRSLLPPYKANFAVALTIFLTLADDMGECTFQTLFGSEMLRFYWSLGVT